MGVFHASVWAWVLRPIIPCFAICQCQWPYRYSFGDSCSQGPCWQMWRAVLHPPGWFLPSARMVTAAEAISPCCPPMPSDLACWVSANSSGLSLFNCPGCNFFHWQATTFPCTTLSMVTAQDLIQSRHIYSSHSISCSNLMKQSLLLIVSTGKDLSQRALVVQNQWSSVSFLAVSQLASASGLAKGQTDPLYASTCI